MSRFAQGTDVSVDRSRSQIERLVSENGATQFVSGWDGPRAMIGFGLRGRHIRFVLNLPDKASKEFTLTPSGRFQRTPIEREKAWEQGCRSRWRALHLVIKAKLEAIACGISTVDDEFMAQTVLPDGRTVGEQLRVQIADQIKAGNPTQLRLTGGAS